MDRRVELAVRAFLRDLRALCRKYSAGISDEARLEMWIDEQFHQFTDLNAMRHWAMCVTEAGEIIEDSTSSAL